MSEVPAVSAIIQITTNWKQALAQLSMVYPDRINRYL